MKHILFILFILFTSVGFCQYKISSVDKDGNELNPPTINNTDTLSFTIAYDEKFDTYYFGVNRNHPKELSLIIEDSFYPGSPEELFNTGEALYFKLTFGTGTIYRVAIFDNPFDDEGFKGYLTDTQNEDQTIYTGQLKIQFDYYHCD